LIEFDAPGCYHFARVIMGNFALDKTLTLTTVVLNGFPLFECDFDRQKIFMFVVVGMFLDGSTSPSKSSTACRASGIFGKKLRSAHP